MTPHEKAKDIYQKIFNNMPHPSETNNMTPHEKAKDIYQKMFNNMPHPSETNAAVFTITKQCALIAVDEIMEQLLENISNDISGIHAIYWEKVKQEIEAL